eukprot:CCRYP_005918-RB/>CCRYP_005918-RB protein AED:0.24 eAED:0.24 QI:476/1/1/1/1/1/4/64/1154
MRGFESTVFAYGQTGTGKTHTMEGSLSSPELYGVIPRSAQAIFEHLKQPQYKDKVVTCSYLEIYNEELRDLLDDGTSAKAGEKSKLEIMEGKNGTFCRGLTEKQVNTAEDVLKLMQKAQHQRIVGETKMNKASSRSHCLFTIQVHGKIALIDGDGDMEFNGKLHMVDLAGSECAKSAGNDKSNPDSVARERERMNINRSLLTLGRVITTLKERSEGKNVNARIPYRDSKLTRILQESLGGRCKTVVVATLSPSITAIEESVSTLNYAQSANGIINKPISSSLISLGPNEYGGKVVEDGNTVESWQEMEMRLQYMQTQVEEAQAALARKHLHQQELQERADKAETSLLENQQKLYQANEEIKSLKAVAETETKKRIHTEKELQHTQINLKKTSLILQATQMTESSLTMEAISIIETLEKVIDERNELHSLIASKINIESGQKVATKEFQQATLVVLNAVESSLLKLCESIELKRNSGLEAANLSHVVGHQFVTDTQRLVDDIASSISSATSAMTSQLVGEKGMKPTVELATNSISSDVHSTRDRFSQGEESWHQSCKLLKESFADCAKMLNKHASLIESSTTQTLKKFETKVTESKDAMLSLVMRLKSSLSNLSQAKAEKTDELLMLVDQWRDQSLEHCKSVTDVTSNSLSTLKASAVDFKKGLHHHETISKTLENQRQFVDSQVKAHVNDIKKQSTSLIAHRDKLARYRDTQKRLHDEVMQSIMATIQTAVKSELGKLVTSHANHCEALDNDGAQLVETNQNLTQSAVQVMDNIESTNKSVCEEASIVFNNDLRASDMMHSTQNTLQQIGEYSTKHYQLTSEYSEKHLSAIDDMKKIDSRNTQIAQMVERDGHECSKSLVNAVLNPTRAEFKKSIQGSLDALMQVDNNVLRTGTSTLDQISDQRRAVASEIASKLEGVDTSLRGLKENVASIVESQHITAEKLNDDVMAMHATFQNTSIQYVIAELDASKERLISTISSMSESTVNTITENTAQSVNLKQTIQDFAHNKMQCDKSVPPAPVKRECKYNTVLPSTPADEVILKGQILNPSERDDSISSSDLSCKAASNDQDDIDASQDSIEDDNRSTLSSGSVSISIPSPGLKSRDINVYHGETHSSMKPRKHSRPTVSTGSFAKKNKIPSGLRTPSGSRKRMRK